MAVHKLFESQDASINVSAEFKPSRFLFGVAYTEAPFTLEVRMRMFAIHIWCVCLTFTRFFVKEATQEEIRREMERRGRNLNVPKRKPGKRRRGRR